MEDFGKLIYLLTLAVITTFANAFIFIKYWKWFIMNIFNLGNINYPQAIGLMLFVSLFIKTLNLKKNKENTIAEITTIFFRWIITLTLMLGLGWLVYLFI